MSFQQPWVTGTTGASLSGKWEWMVWEGAVRALQYQQRSPLLGTRWFWLMFCLWCGGRQNARLPGAASCPLAGHLEVWSSASGFGLGVPRLSMTVYRARAFPCWRAVLCCLQVWRGPGTQGTLKSSKAKRCLLAHGSFQSLSWELLSSASAVALCSLTSYPHFLAHWFCFPFVYWL